MKWRTKANWCVFYICIPEGVSTLFFFAYPYPNSFHVFSSPASRDEWLEVISNAIEDYTKKMTTFSSSKGPEEVLADSWLFQFHVLWRYTRAKIRNVTMNASAAIMLSLVLTFHGLTTWNDSIWSGTCSVLLVVFNVDWWAWINHSGLFQWLSPPGRDQSGFPDDTSRWGKEFKKTITALGLKTVAFHCTSSGIKEST